MKENSIVRENLMNQAGYAPYCGGDNCPTNPRANWDNEIKQFRCYRCGWVSALPDDFIKRYTKKWELQTKTCIVCGQIKPVYQMRNVDTLNGADSEWIYACRGVNPHGLGGSCLGKYDRSIHLKNHK